MKYRCDYRYTSANGVSCNQAATFAFERNYGWGQEHRYLCAHHSPSDWTPFDSVYRIVNDELMETGISKQRREPVAVGEPVSQEMIREAVRKHWEKKQDVLIMHSLGVKYE